jgi:hypothetical protein
MANCDGGNNGDVGSSGVVCVMTAAGNGKHQARLPTDHIERLLEEACPNHPYPIKHKLRDCITLKNFMVSGSLTRGMGLNKVLGESDATPFLGEDTIMMIYDGALCHMSNLSLGTPTHCGWGHGNAMAQIFQYHYIYVYVYVYVYEYKHYNYSKCQRKDNRQDSLRSQGRWTCQVLDLGTGIGGTFLL